MMKQYFASARTAEELKALYFKTVKELHPDNGGDPEAFKEMQAEYTKTWDRLKNIHTAADGNEYTKETTETAAEFMDILEKVINLPEIQIEICGRWIWINGNTYPVKDQLKAAGFKFAGKKKAWYYRREEDAGKWHGKKRLSMDEIRSRYGSENVRSEELAFLTM